MELSFLGEDFQLLISKDTLTIKAPSPDAANELADTASDQLALAIANLNFKAARIIWDNCSRPFRILAAMAGSTDNSAPAPIVTPMVFGTNLNFDALDLRILARIQESEKPMSLVGLAGVDEDKQKWVNSPLLQMLQRPEDWATSLDLKTLWDADNLEDLKNQLRQQSSVDLSNYRAYLPYAPGIFTATFEVVQFSLYPKSPKVPMRLVTVGGYEPLERTAPVWV